MTPGHGMPTHPAAPTHKPARRIRRLGPVLFPLALTVACSGEPGDRVVATAKPGAPEEAPAPKAKYSDLTEPEVLALDPQEWTDAVAKQIERVAIALESVGDRASAEAAAVRLDELGQNLQMLVEMRRGNLDAPAPEVQEMFEARLKFYFHRIQKAGEGMADQPELQAVLEPVQQRLLKLFQSFGPATPR